MTDLQPITPGDTMNRTITIAFPIHVPVRQFADEFERLGEELRDIEEALNGTHEIDWIVDRVDAEGSVVTLRAVGTSTAAIEQVIDAYRSRAFAPDISVAPHDQQPSLVTRGPGVSSLVGDVVQGADLADRVFMIRDHAYQSLVRCFLAPGADVETSSLEGQRVRVHGLLVHDHRGGQIVEILDVDEVTIIEPAADRMAVWHAVRGILTPRPDAPLPEESIRRMRDEW